MAKFAPQSIPQARCFHADPNQISNFFGDLRLISKIGDKHPVARCHQQQCAGAGKAGEVTDVGAPGNQQRIQIMFR